MFVVEFDLGQLEPAVQLGLVPQTILESTARIILSDEELDRFRVVKLGGRVQTHRMGRYSAIRGEASVSSRLSRLSRLSLLTGHLSCGAGKRMIASVFARSLRQEVSER